MTFDGKDATLEHQFVTHLEFTIKVANYHILEYNKLCTGKEA